MGMFKDKVFGLVSAGVSMVPDPVREVMRTKTARAGIGVIGSACTAYAIGECGGVEAIAGTFIGLGFIFGRRAVQKSANDIMAAIFRK